ncbi:DMT family transporter [bacterium]|nr:DMT family transporter [bacterium]
MPETLTLLRRDDPRAGFWWSLAGVSVPAAVFFIIPALTAELGVLGMGALWFPTAVGFYLLLALVLGRFKKLIVPRGSRLQVVLLGTVQAVGTALFFTALTVAEPSLVAFVGNATPFFTVVGSWIIFKERFRGKQLIGGVLVVAGALVITRYDESGSVTGILLMAAGCLLFAVHTLLGRHLTRRVDPLALGFWRTSFMAVGFVAAALVSGNLRLPSTGHQWLLILIGGLIGPVGSIFTYYLALSNWGAGKVDLVRSSLSLWVLVWSVALYGRLPTPIQLLGGALTVVGVILLIARRQPAAESGEKP